MPVRKSLKTELAKYKLENSDKQRAFDDAFDDNWRNDPLYSTSSSYKGSTSINQKFGSCYEKHPPLKLPGTEFVIYGGSCMDPFVTDADVYVGFQTGMKRTAREWPWKKGVEFQFPIQDMNVPPSIEEFKKLLKWLKAQIDEGKKVHIGCIGGHGRTGLVLSALVSMYGELDAVTYVRANYCHKAVESSKQMSYLAEHFGIKAIAASKIDTGPVSTKKSKGLGSSSKVSLLANQYVAIDKDTCMWGF